MGERRSVEEMQGFRHAANMFEGTMIDPIGARQICDNLEQTARQQPPGFAAGVMKLVARVRRELEKFNP